MLINVLLLIIGFTLLIKGADCFVDGASAMAKRLKIPAIIIGLTVVVMGTSARGSCQHIFCIGWFKRHCNWQCSGIKYCKHISDTGN